MASGDSFVLVISHPSWQVSSRGGANYMNIASKAPYRSRTSSFRRSMSQLLAPHRRVFYKPEISMRDFRRALACSSIFPVMVPIFNMQTSICSVQTNLLTSWRRLCVKNPSSFFYRTGPVLRHRLRESPIVSLRLWITIVFVFNVIECIFLGGLCLRRKNLHHLFFYPSYVLSSKI